MRSVIENLIKYRSFLASLVARDIRKKYHGSVLGVAWCILDPVLNTAVITLVFSYVLGRGIPNFPLYIMSGRMIFNLTIGATSTSLHSISKNGGIINKIYTPKYMFVISDLAVAFINMLFSFVPLIPLMIIYRVPVTVSLLILPLVIIVLFFFTLGLCLILSAYGIAYKDLSHLYGIFTTLWFFLTPIFYTLDAIDPRYHFLWRLNPMTHFVQIFRDIMYSGIMPSSDNFIIAGAFAVIFFGLGCVIFNERQNKFFLYL